MTVLPLKLCMFDLDGTLIDSVPDLATAVDNMLQSFDLPAVGEPQVRSWVGNGAVKLVERALLFSFSSLPENEAEKQCESLRAMGLKRFFAYYEQCCTEKTVLYAGVLEALAAFQQQGVTMAIVTNKPRQFVEPILKALSIEHYFVFILGGDDLPLKKPDAAPLLHCMGELGFNKQETLMVGDSRNDVQAARNADVLVAAVDYGYNHGSSIEDERPDLVISDISHLIAKINIG